MPLPPAPSKRADRLTAKDFEAPARANPRPQRKAQPTSEPAPIVTTNGVTRSKPVAKKAQIAALTQPPVAVPLPVKAVSSAKAATAPAAPVRRAKKTSTGPSKLFVLDTNVLLHDPMCLFRFEEHDIYLPMIVLEELDGHKKGMTEVARNARQTSRTLDTLAGAPGADPSLLQN